MPKSKLVIVESPAKARTISGYLGPDYQVEASIGHIRDLPQPSELPADMKKGPFGKFAVNVEDGFEPYYVVDSGKKKKVTELRRALKESDELILATDEDREGEAIAWHLLEILKPKVPVKRMVFHEITKEAIASALENTRELDLNLVDAQETRRILDRLYGYEISPLLWRKVRTGLSAGRVQSVATRLVVERERERMNFVAAQYWDVSIKANSGGQEFTALLQSLGGQRLATGRDFADNGQLKKAELLVLDRAGAQNVAAQLQEVQALSVSSLETKPYTRRPAAPFTTSTLQQEASRKLRMSSRDAMRTAQTLYENGYITYMRTDSPALSDQATAAARAQAVELYGKGVVPTKARRYATKSKGAQEAHEAIRPAGQSFRTPESLATELSGAALELYDLIWKRTVASQMNDALGQTATVRLGTDLKDGRRAEFSASGTVITQRGFLDVYKEGRDADRYGKGESVQLPPLSEGEQVGLSQVDWEDRGHTTTPPPRYTEASLVKAMEERGIGRPSTYAATISVITDRGYVNRKGNALVPSWLAFSVTRLLEQNLSHLVDYDFTAGMEADLDQIAAGKENRNAWLKRFYHGSEEGDGLAAAVAGLGDIDARAVNSWDIGEDITMRVGRYGPYLENAEGGRASIPDSVAPDELTLELAKELFERAADDGRLLGKDPVSGHEIVAKDGRFGPYVTEIIPEEETDGAKKAPKPRTGSLFKSMSLSTVSLEQALQLLALPRVVGADPVSGDEITAQNGRYGPYLKKGTDSRSLTSEDQIFTVSLEEAVAIFAEPKRRGRAAAAPLREFGADPVSGKPIVLKDGRFGPYVTDGETNASLRKGDEVATLTEERAFELLADRRAKGPVKRKAPAKKAAAKKTPAKKTTAKKTTAKKAPAKKTVTKKTTAKKTTARKTATTKED